MLLPNKLHTEGRLEHYSLHYNVALVSFKGCGDLATANIHDPGAVHSPQVVAVGRCFESSVLMATSGTLTGWQSRFDCSCVLYSTCEVTKVHTCVIFMFYMMEINFASYCSASISVIASVKPIGSLL